MVLFVVCVSFDSSALAAIIAVSDETGPIRDAEFRDEVLAISQFDQRIGELNEVTVDWTVHLTTDIEGRNNSDSSNLVNVDLGAWFKVNDVPCSEISRLPVCQELRRTRCLDSPWTVRDFAKRRGTYHRVRWKITSATDLSPL